MHPSPWTLSLLLLCFNAFIPPTLSSSTTTTSDDDSLSLDSTEDDGGGDTEDNYASIYIAMIIMFSILFVVVICCLLYRIYKKRQSDHGDTAHGKGNGKSDSMGGSAAKSHSDGDKDHLPQPEQVKFRGSMSSVEHRHERIPSKPVVIAITTPKGTRHVADAFGDYDGDNPDHNGTGDESGDPDLPGIHEDAEEEYNNEQNGNAQKANSENDDREHIHSESKEEDEI